MPNRRRSRPPRARCPIRQAPPGRALARMHDLDRGFDPARFLEGAEGAFRLIVGAFAAGNRDQLRPLLTADTFAGFEAAIAAREAAGETHRTEIRAIRSATIEEATLLNTLADITVRFVTDQVNVTLDKTGPAGRRHRCGDRDFRPLDLRARAGSARERAGLAAGGRAQRLMRRRLAALAALLAAAALAACAVPPPGAPGAPLTPVAFSQLPGWPESKPAAVLRAFVQGCAALAQLPPRQSVGGSGETATLAGEAGQWTRVCADANALKVGDEAAARAFFERDFQPYALGSGLVTGYYEPEVRGSLRPTDEYQVPLLRLPPDLVRAQLGQFDPDLKGRQHHRPRRRLDAGALFRPPRDRGRRARRAGPGTALAAKPDRRFFPANPGLRAGDPAGRRAWCASPMPARTGANTWRSASCCRRGARSRPGR